MPSLWREVTAGAPAEDPDPTYTPAPRVGREASDRVDGDRVDLDALVETLSTAPPPPLALPAVALPPEPRRARALPRALAAAAFVVAAFLAGLLVSERGAHAPAPTPSHDVAPPVAAPHVVTLEPVVFPAAQPERETPAPRRAAPRVRSSAPAARPSTPAPAEEAEPSVAPVPSVVPDDAALVEAPGRADVRAALEAITADVEACAQPADAGQLARVRITFGSDGRALHAVVDGVSGATASCIARAARGAQVPPFTREHFVVAAPFTL